VKFGVSIFQNSFEKMQISLKMSIITRTLREDFDTFMITYSSISFVMGKSSYKLVEKIKTFYVM
jgi:hypothetical protein